MVSNTKKMICILMAVAVCALVFAGCDASVVRPRQTSFSSGEGGTSSRFPSSGNGEQGTEESALAPTATPYAMPTASASAAPEGVVSEGSSQSSTVSSQQVETNIKPSAVPTAEPKPMKTPQPTKNPQPVKTPKPTKAPKPGASATSKPLETATPTAKPTAAPTAKPTAAPTASPAPTAKPTVAPTVTPTAEPTAAPTVAPTTEPTAAPTATPTTEPTAEPTATPTMEPTSVPVPLNQQVLHFTVNGSSLDLPLSEDGASFDLQTLNTEYPVAFTLVTNESLTVQVGGKAVTPGQETQVSIDSISADETIPVTVSAGSDTRTVYVRTLNSNIPALAVAGESPNEGDYYLSFVTRPLILKLDENGEILYYNCGAVEEPAKTPAEDAEKTDTTEEKILPSGTGDWDFKKHTLENGDIRYSYLEQNPLFNKLQTPGYAAGERVILDEKYNEIDRIQMKDDKEKNVPAGGNDFIMIGDGHYILANYELKLVDNVPASLNPDPQGSKVIAAHLQEIEDGKVVFDWYSTDYPEFYALSKAPYNDYANEDSQQPDYMHFSSMALDPEDDNLVCSFRNIDSIVKIDRKTGGVVWILSGKGDQFSLEDAQKTSGQSYVRFTKDGLLTIFDNGVADEKTRIVRLKLDEAAKTVSDYEEFAVPGHYSEYYGSADNLKDDVFCIGWGYFESEGAALTEIDFATNKKLFELTLPDGAITYTCAKYK